ncbi:Hypothetical predicted protein [Olea europaea subsp. europaea]|uniref:Uncharacterized protein n=1 Tax=Olea europaea subsp. europaea TaxID=158383 RepID=A0A8S0V3Q9_OLEEU|nr:Hypothetical predicted protein [Olea europaea subsp. europaea]
MGHMYRVELGVYQLLSARDYFSFVVSLLSITSIMMLYLDQENGIWTKVIATGVHTDIPDTLARESLDRQMGGVLMEAASAEMKNPAPVESSPSEEVVGVPDLSMAQEHFYPQTVRTKVRFSVLKEKTKNLLSTLRIA